MARGWLSFALLAIFSAPGSAQTDYDTPERVTVGDLTTTPGLYNEKMVLVRGVLQTGDMVDSQNRIMELRGDNALDVVRVGQENFALEDIRFLSGHEVEIVGVFWDLTTEVVRTGDRVMPLDPRLRRFPGAVRSDMESFPQKQYFIGVASVESVEEDIVPDLEEPEEELVDPDIEVPDSSIIDLRLLLESPDAYVNQQIAVIGKFRGDNVFGDLSIRDKKTPRDFVIKVADAAIWVTGKRPRGKDFRLDPDRRLDTGKWLKVIGVPWTDEEDRIYLRAQKIEIADDPGDPSLEPIAPEDVAKDVEAEPLPPPDLVFSLPIDGERNVPLDADFRVQFSKDMNRASFDRNVDLLYDDDDGFSNPFPDLRISYDAGSRTLIVDPGRSLEPDRDLQLILYQQIMDEDGQNLVANPEASEIDGAAVILHFHTASH